MMNAAPSPSQTPRMHQTGTAVLALALYLVAALALLSRLLGKGPAFLRERRGLMLSSAVAAVMLHSVALYALLFTPMGMDLGFFNVLALTGWMMAMVGLSTFLKD